MKNKILKLINSLEFQQLKSYCREKTLTVESCENRHSAFIAWWLNPKSEHGLGDAPLKLFLRLAATKRSGKATFGIDGFDGAFYSRVLAGDYNVGLIEDIAIEKDGIDIWTVLDLTYEEDGKVDRRIIPVVMESKDGKGLTERYLNAVTSYAGIENVELAPMGILLTEEPTQPSCSQFDNITYQELSDYVIEPLMCNVSLQRLVDNNREIFDTAFASLYRPSAVAKIIDENSMVMDTTKEEINLLRMLWDSNEAVFEAAIYHLYKEQHQAELDKIFKSSTEDDAKYVVSHNGKAIFPGKCLSKSMTACAIFKAYIEEYPETTLIDLQKAFPCEELNHYYYDRIYSDLFYESDPYVIDFDETLDRCDFYLDAEQMLPIENGTKKAICVRIWRKVDFDRLIGFVHDRGYDRFISIVGC